VKRLVLLIVAAPVLLFIVQNIQVTELRFLIWRIAMPHALLLILVLAAGVLMGWVLHALLADGKRKQAAAPPATTQQQ
jgi:uncharacterized integral membrane protein